MKYFPVLPTLTFLLRNYSIPQKYDFQSVFLISVQHLLRTTGSLFESILQIGFKPENIYLTGKIYSTHKETQEKLRNLRINLPESTKPDINDLGSYSHCLKRDVQNLWKLLIEKIPEDGKIIILDDGGYVLKNIPPEVLQKHRVFGIEQTTFGIRLQNGLSKFPIIDVASSATKKTIEPPFVSEAVLLRLGYIFNELNPKNIGIVGYGNIGRAIANDFVKKFDVCVYDIKKELFVHNKIDGVNYCNSLSELYNISEIIIGATGEDISKKSWLTDSNENKILISVSSGDFEFNKLIRKSFSNLTHKLESPLQDLILKTEKGHQLKIIRGGFVANFTGGPDSSPGHIIQFTRGLLFSAILQILIYEEQFKSMTGSVMLSPELQKMVTQTWFKDQPQKKSDYSDEVGTVFTDENWIKENSEGLLIEGSFHHVI